MCACECPAQAKLEELYSWGARYGWEAVTLDADGRPVPPVQQAAGVSGAGTGSGLTSPHALGAPVQGGSSSTTTASVGLTAASQLVGALHG